MYQAVKEPGERKLGIEQTVCAKAQPAGDMVFRILWRRGRR